MGTRFPLPVLLLSAAVLSTGTTALAGPTPAAPRGAPATPSKPKDRADDLFDQATAALDAKRFPEAEAKYEEAWGLKQTYDIAGNFGVTKRLLGKNREAAQLLTWALQHMPPTEGSSTRKGLEQELQKARAEIGALRVRVNVDAATVTVNGRDAGPSPIADEVFVDPGTVNVQARRDGYVTAEQTLAVAKGDAREVTLALAQVTVQRRSIVPGAVLGGVAGAALVTGIGLMVAGANKHASNTSLNQAITQAHHSCVTDATNFDQQQCEALASGAATADTLNHVGIGVLIGAGAAAVGSVVYFLWPESKPSAQRAGGIHVAPTVSTSGGGMLFSGAF
jgi:hypothetical protein